MHPPNSISKKMFWSERPLTSVAHAASYRPPCEPADRDKLICLRRQGCVIHFLLGEDIGLEIPNLACSHVSCRHLTPPQFCVMQVTTQVMREANFITILNRDTYENQVYDTGAHRRRKLQKLQEVKPEYICKDVEGNSFTRGGSEILPKYKKETKLLYVR